MKKIIFLFVISLIALHIDAQVKFGIMTGKSPNHISTGEIFVDNDIDSLRININSPNAPWLLGPYIRVQAGKLFLQTGLMIGFSKVDYEVDYLAADSLVLKNDWEWNLNVPIEVGYMFFDDRMFVKAGILGGNYFQHEKENGFLVFDEKLVDIFRNRNFGYRIGLGFDLENSATISVSYTNFQNASSSIVVNDIVDYDFDFRQHQIMVNFNWNFIKN